MKKFVCLTLLLCLVAFLLCGCGNDEGDENSSSGLNNTPATTSPSPTPEPQNAKALRVTADSGLNIRAQASTDSEILGSDDRGRSERLVSDPIQGTDRLRFRRLRGGHRGDDGGVQSAAGRDGFSGQLRELRFFHLFACGEQFFPEQLFRKQHIYCFRGHGGRRITTFPFSCPASVPGLFLPGGSWNRCKCERTKST